MSSNMLRSHPILDQGSLSPVIDNKTKSKTIFMGKLFRKKIKSCDEEISEIKALVIGKKDVGKSLFISKMTLEKSVNLKRHNSKEKFKSFPQKTISNKGNTIRIEFVEFTSQIKLGPAYMRNFDLLYFLIEDKTFLQDLEEVTRRLYSIKNWNISRKEIIIIINKRDSQQTYDEILKFDPNYYWKDFYLKKIHSFYLDVKTLKNLKREVPLILSEPLDSFLFEFNMNISVISNSNMISSLKSSEISTIHLGVNKEKDDFLSKAGSFTSEGNLRKEKNNCRIF